MVQLWAGSSWPCDSRPVYVFQNCVAMTRPPKVSEQQVSTCSGVAWAEQDQTGVPVD